MATIKLDNRDHASSVTIAIHIAAGPHKETEEARGAAHVLEHLVFRTDGTSLEDACEAVGGYANAATGTFSTEYWARVPIGCEDWALDRLLSALTAPRFTAADLQAELEILQREANFYAGDALENALDQLLAPYGITRVATNPALTADQILAFHQNWYTDATISIALVGKLSASLVEKAQQTILPPALVPRHAPRPLSLGAPHAQHRQRNQGDDVIGLARHLPQLDGLEAHALELIERALFGRGSGILNRSVQQRFNVYEVASHLDQQPSGSTWYLLSTTAPGEAREALTFLEEELDRFAREGMSQDLFERNVTKYKGGMLLERENPLHYARRIAREARRTAPVPIDALTLDKVNEVLVNCMTTPASTTTITGAP